MESSIGTAFNEVFEEKLFADKLTEQFTREEWEFTLVFGLKRIFTFYQIERVGGKEEKNHGIDFLIKIPCLLSKYSYAIAIQVENYEGFVGKEVISQINKADDYWESENLKLIEIIVIITKAKKDDDMKLLDHDKNVKSIFATELKQLMSEIGKCFIGMK